jgi:hypothetical protein
MGQAPAPGAGASCAWWREKCGSAALGTITEKGMHNMYAAQVYLRVGEAVAAHAVGENDDGPGAGARSRRQLRLVEKTGDLEPKILIW